MGSLCFTIMVLFGLVVVALMVYGAFLIMRKGILGTVKKKRLGGLYGQESGK